MTQEEGAHSVVLGRVKWFDASKGFGFIVVEGDVGDILLHANVLRNFGQSSVVENTLVTVKVSQTPRGLQAFEIVDLAPPEGAQSANLAGLTNDDEAAISQVEIEPARVKWFDKVKGFGFANVFGSAEDIFIHVEVLHRSGFADLAPGEAVGLRIIEGPRGRMAAQVTSWEAALKK